MKHVWALGLMVLVGCADRAPEYPTVDVPFEKNPFTRVFNDLPSGQTKPTRDWVKKALRNVAGVHTTTTKRVTELASYPTEAAALGEIISSNQASFIDKMRDFNLRFIEFHPPELYTRDALTGDVVDSVELGAFTNAKHAADAVWSQGDFFSLLDFDWPELIQQGHPYGKPEEQGLFFSQFASKPFHRVWFTSGSNRHRKKAAWVLRNFLCDDLTPSGDSATPKDDTSGYDKTAQAHANATHSPLAAGYKPKKIDQHAMDGNCKSCHWKLDYIGGFFRYMGTFGDDWQKKGKSLQYLHEKLMTGTTWDDYMSDWQTEGGKWNVGVRRGITSPTPKDWDASKTIADPIPSDLFNYLKTAPEFKQCLTNRMAKFFVEEKMTYDNDWIESLAARFDGPPSRSGKAFVEVMGTLAFSRSFHQWNPSPAICYDVVDGATPSRIPCKVASILRNNCQSCHGDSTYHLVLKDVSPLANGKPWLDHTDDKNARLSPAESLRRIEERLKSNDTAVRMPLGQAPLTESDRETLLDWLKKLAEEAK